MWGNPKSLAIYKKVGVMVDYEVSQVNWISDIILELKQDTQCFLDIKNVYRLRNL